MLSIMRSVFDERFSRDTTASLLEAPKVIPAGDWGKK